MKIYDKEFKYRNIKNDFSTKFKIFINLYLKVNIIQPEYINIFSIIFIDKIRDFYYKKIISKFLRFEIIIEFI